MSAEAGFLLDTNVVSEAVRPRPDAGVLAWLAEVDEDQLFLSVATLAEINRGIERLSPGRRRRRLAAWLAHDLIERFEQRILPVDATVGLHWGSIVARAELAGRSIEAMDALVAATAQANGLILVTRNVADFAPLGLPLHDPWSAPAR